MNDRPFLVLPSWILNSKEYTNTVKELYPHFDLISSRPLNAYDAAMRDFNNRHSIKWVK